MRHHITRYFLPAILLFCIPCLSLAQQRTASPGRSAELYRQGVALFSERNWGSALQVFEELQKQDAGLLSDACFYYIAAARLELGNPNGESELKKFVEEMPESPLVNPAQFRLANCLFVRKSYREALQTYQKVDYFALNYDDQDTYTYNTGVCLLETNDMPRAKASFQLLRNKKGPLGDGARFYWAHISFQEGNWDDAWTEFDKLENVPVYFKVVPWYRMQILFAKGDYQAVAEKGLPLLAKAPDDRKFELARVVATSLYQLEQYSAAAEVVDKYFTAKDISRQDCYVAGFCEEKSGKPDAAIRWYEKSVQQKDAIAQATYYQLGALYMNKGDKQKGLQAFQHAADMKFDPAIRKDALFQYAKATYELDYSPFNESIKALDKYITEYPDAKENDAAYNYLVNVFMTTHNYRDALVSMDRIKVKSPAVKKAYQRVCLYRGMELFRDLNFSGALKLFDKSLENGSYNPAFKSQAQYWKAEALFRLGKNDESLAEYKKFQSLPGSQRTSEYPLSFYNMGYYYFNRQDLTMAATCFNRYVALSPGDNAKVLGDVYNRLGDCEYAGRSFTQALGYYDKAIELNDADADYAMYQVAFTRGLMQEHQAKIDGLAALMDKYPDSPYCDDALFETGKARERISDFEGARASYKEMMQKYPNSPLVPKALVQLGLIAYNQKQYDQSIGYYKEVISRFPDTPEARGALTGVRNNYMENNQVEDYISYTKNLGKDAAPSQNEQDSLTYFAAEKLYMGHAANAEEQLTKYLSGFPKGNFTVNAHFYRAECFYAQGDTAQALRDYEAVLSEADNLFTEPALGKAAELAFEVKNYIKALGYYQRIGSLESNQAAILAASTGELRCRYALGQWDELVKTGTKIRGSGKISPELDRECAFKMAKAYEALGDQVKALPLWRRLAADPKSMEGAEAKYMVCKYYFDNNRLKDSENEVMDFISRNSPQKFWLGKSFILLAHVYEKMNDLFQATNTLKSVIENYDSKDDGIISEASAYLKVLEQKK